MDILIFGRGIPTDENPQEGCFEWDQAKCLKSIGHNVIYMFIDARLRNGHHQWGIKKSLVNGIKVYQIYFGTLSFIQRTLGSNLENIISKRLALILFKHIIKKEPNIDIVHSHYIWSANRSLNFRKVKNIPLVATEHLSKMVYPWIPRFIYNLGKKTYKSLDALITVSPYLQQAIEEKFGIASVVCPNVLSSEFELVQLTNSKNKDSKFRFVACGSLLERKGFDVLIKAASILTIPKNCWQIEIIGSGPLKNNLKSMIDEYSLTANIILSGKKTKQEIITTYSESDCFILSSKSETFGVVLIEALAMGLPCIATECGGTNGLMDENAGIYIPVDDVDSLANAMKYMYDNGGKYDSMSIRNKCLTKYSSNAIAQELTQIYENTINNK